MCTFCQVATLADVCVAWREHVAETAAAADKMTLAGECSTLVG